MKKTALQQLIEYNNELILEGKLSVCTIHSLVIQRANELITEEREIIEEAFDQGDINGYKDRGSTGSCYYSETFVNE